MLYMIPMNAIYKSNECYKYIDDVYNIMCGRTIL